MIVCVCVSDFAGVCMCTWQGLIIMGEGGQGGVCTWLVGGIFFCRKMPAIPPLSDMPAFANRIAVEHV